jgi:hypothetical protein
MLDHAGIVVTDHARPRRFYEAVASALGLGIDTPAAKYRSTVDEFYRAVMSAGGRDNGRPGPRQGGDA